MTETSDDRKMPTLQNPSDYSSVTHLSVVITIIPTSSGKIGQGRELEVEWMPEYAMEHDAHSFGAIFGIRVMSGGINGLCSKVPVT